MVERREKRCTCLRRWGSFRLAEAAPWIDHKRIPGIFREENL